MRLGERIKELRVSRNLTQDQLAKLLHCSRSAVKMYELDERRPKYEMLEEMADIFNVDMEYLIGRTNTEKKNSVVILDDDMVKVLEVLKTRPEMKTLFSVASDASDEDIARSIAIIEALKKNG